MHDAAEQVTGDMNSPLKSLCPDYKKVQTIVEKYYSKKFGFEYPLSQDVKDADLLMLYCEGVRFGMDTDEWGIDFSRIFEKYAPETISVLIHNSRDYKMLPYGIRCLSHTNAKELFIKRYNELGGMYSTMLNNR